MDLLPSLIAPPTINDDGTSSLAPAASEIERTASTHPFAGETISIDQFQANVAARNAGRPTTPSRATSAVIDQGQNSPSSQFRNVAIPLGRPRTPEHVITLYQLCAEYCIPKPEFEFFEHGRNAGKTYSSRLTLSFPIFGEAQNGDAVERVFVDSESSYGSKKEAKEEVSEKGCQAVRDAVTAQVEIAVAEVEKQPRARLPPQISSGKGEEDYITLLIAYCSSYSMPQPTYQFYDLGGGTHACSVTIVHGVTKDNGEAVDHRVQQAPTLVFGDPRRPLNGKKAAKRAAAKEAVVWLRENNYSKNAKPSSVQKKSARDQKPMEDMTRAEQINAFRKKLGLGNYEYRLESMPGSCFFTGAVHFPGEIEGSLSGPLAKVTNVLGKKNAKNEIARTLVGILEAEVWLRDMVTETSSLPGAQ